MDRFAKIVCLILTIVFSSPTIADEIKKINIIGNQIIEQSTIKKYLFLNIGDNLSESIKSTAIKNLYSSSLFENIYFEFTNGTLNVFVEEAPFVSEIEFRGNYTLKAELLSKEMHTSPGSRLKAAKLSTDINKIEGAYTKYGRPFTIVKPQIEIQENNRVKVILNIQESPKIRVRNIFFVGNTSYQASKLHSVIMTRESKWFNFFETHDDFNPDRIDFDKHLLSKFYNSVGFADFRVISAIADLLPRNRGFSITYSIDEGSKYNFGKITLSNKSPNELDKEVLKFINNKQYGQTYNYSVVEKVIDNISEYLVSKGYTQLNIRPEIYTNSSTKTVDVTIFIEEANTIFINNINIDGNLKTEDHVIRRQLRIFEGDTFNKTNIELSERNIRNLDYFNKLSLRVLPTQNINKYDININVEEKSTAHIGFDIGYNTAGGPFGRISLLERNIIGTGKEFSISAQSGRRNMHYHIGLLDPYFMEKNLSLGASVYRNHNGKGSGFGSSEQNYSIQSTGAKFSFGYNITDDLTHSVEYLIKRERVRSLGEHNTNSIFIKEQAGNYNTSLITHNLTYDKLDSTIFPKNGYILSITQESAGIGGNNKYSKYETDIKVFKSFINSNYTLKLSSAFGSITGRCQQKVRISDRFNIGDYSLRGFAYNGIGPRDILTNEGLGGQKYYRFSTEINFPIGMPEQFNITGATFIDLGSLWDIDSKYLSRKGFYNKKSIRASAGFGLLWVTKMSPIRIDWGFPIKSEHFDEKQSFHIKFSTSL